jgi:hypothetical protein
MGLYQITEKSYRYGHEEESNKLVQAGEVDQSFCGWFKARTAGVLVGVNFKSSGYYFRRLRGADCLT